MRRLALSTALAIGVTACAPNRGEVRQVAGTHAVVMHEDTYRDLEARAKQAPDESNGNTGSQDADALRQRNAALIDEVDRLTRQTSSLQDEAERLRGQLADKSSAKSDRVPNSSRDTSIVQLYFASLGIQQPTYEDYRLLSEVLSLQAVLKQVTTGPLMDPHAQKEEIERNFLYINGASGVLLSSNGYFITNHHIVEDSTSSFYVEYGSKSYAARCFLSYKEFDAALCKMAIGEGEEFRVNKIRFAPLNKIKRDKFVEVLGRVDGNVYYQVGRITNPEYTALVLGKHDKPEPFYQTVRTSSYAQPGFSGGPVFLKDTGELVGLTCHADPGRESGACRVDHFLELIKWQIKYDLEALEKRH